MKVFRTSDGVVIEHASHWLRGSFSIDRLFGEEDPVAWLEDQVGGLVRSGPPEAVQPPIEHQEVWAAGVTYYRSREARMEESKSESDVYDRVYTAERPELFFKATPHRVVGHGQTVAIRSDSDWNVPEAELAVAVTRHGRIFGYTIGNDMSSRSIEGDNPLYLPQAKIYDASCALGPGLWVTDEAPPPSAKISLSVTRGGAIVSDGETRLSAMKRTARELVDYLFLDNSFPDGCFLLTGTGIVPDGSFTLRAGDVVSIRIDGLGVLENTVRKGH